MNGTASNGPADEVVVGTTANGMDGARIISEHHLNQFSCMLYFICIYAHSTLHPSYPSRWSDGQMASMSQHALLNPSAERLGSDLTDLQRIHHAVPFSAS